MARRSSDSSRAFSLLVVIALVAFVLTGAAAHAQLIAVVDVSATPSPSILGQSVTFTATVTAPAPVPPAPANPAPTGAVNFYITGSSSPFGIGQINTTTGVATFTTSVMPVGSQTIMAFYMGDSNYEESPSPAFGGFTVSPRPAAVTAVAVPSSVVFATPGGWGSSLVTGTVYDSATTGPSGTAGSFTLLTGLLTTTREGHTSNLLSDGSVLITGGYDPSETGVPPLNTVENFNPVSGTFSAVTGNMLQARTEHTATLLWDGVTTLITGGDATGDAELYTYNLATGIGSSVATTNSMIVARTGHTATLLPNWPLTDPTGLGQVLIIGGSDEAHHALNNSLEVYDIKTQTFATVTGSLAYTREYHTTTLLSISGSVATLLVAGGDVTGPGTGTAELITYDFSTFPGTFTEVGSAPWGTARFGHVAALLPDGQTVIFAGGETVGTSNVLASAELFQASSIGNFTAATPSFVTVPSPTSLNVTRVYSSGTLLNTGYVLVTGGAGGSGNSSFSTGELYQPAYDPLGPLAITDTDASDAITDPLLLSPITNCALVLSGAGSSSCAATVTPTALDLVFDPRTIGFVYTDPFGEHVATPTYSNTSLGVGLQTITFTSPGDQTYGVSPFVLSATSSSGLPVTLYINFGPATFITGAESLAPASLMITGAGPVSITASQAGNGFWAPATSVTIVFMVQPKPATVTINSVSKVYGSADPALTGTLSGFVPSDNVTATYSRAAGETVGVYPITATLSPAGLVQNNYTVTTIPGNLTITQATPVNASWATPAGITYGTALSGAQLNAVNPTWTVLGVPGPILGTWSYTPAAGTVLHAGNGQTLSATFTPTDTTDFATETLTTTINVAKATPVIPSWAPPAAITYGTALSSTQLNAVAPSWTVGGTSGTVAGAFLYTPPLGTVLHAGNTQTLTAVYNPSDTLDYNSSPPLTVNINVNQAAPTVTWANPANITYGTALSGTQLNATSSWTVGGVTGPVAGTFTYTPAAGTVLAAGNGQVLQVLFLATDDADYVAVHTTVTINVAQATPTITWATPAGITYGTALSGTQLNATSSWTVGGTAGPVAGTFTYTPPLGQVLPAGNGQTLSVSFAPTDTTDYTTATDSVTINVAKATLTSASWATPVGITYGTALSSTQLNAVAPTWTVGGTTAPVAGAWVYTPPAGTVLLAGSGQTLTATFTPTDTTDFNSPEILTVTINVAKATPVIVMWPAPAAITYGTGLSATQLDAVTPVWTVGSTPGTVAGTIAYTLGTGAYEGGAAKTSVAGQAAMGAVLNAGTITLQAVFTPTDTSDYNTSAPFTVPITVNLAPTATVTTVTVMPTLPAATGAITYTITATVASPIAAYCVTATCPLPTGSVSFYNGSAIAANLLGTGTLSLVKGIPTATYTTTASQLPTPASGSVVYQVTPLYSGDLDYSAAATGSTAPSAPIAVSANEPQYAPANFSVTMTVAPPAGITLTNLTCSVYSLSLAAVSSTATCTISPAGTTLTGSESMTVTVTLAGGTTTASTSTPFRPVLALLGLPVFGLLLFGFSGDSRTSRRRKVMIWLGLAIVLLTLLGLSGCGASFSGGVPLANGGTTPGIYVVHVVGTDSAGNATTVAVIPLQVLQ
ncbi:MAG: MBG domain-containing protein [Candidatus Korobacteraceae bacterium]|jgi:hypothetical protein